MSEHMRAEALNKAFPSGMSAYYKEDAGPAGEEIPNRTRELRKLVRGLDQNPKKSKNPHSATLKDKQNGFLELSGAPASSKNDRKNTKKPVHYHFMALSSRIARAKTSWSAAQAVSVSKRKVLEIKGKISAGESDPGELHLALIHAKRMEMAARKKMHHLELEELSENTRRREERQEKEEEAASAMRDATLSAGEEELSRREDEIFEERLDLLQEAKEDFREQESEIREEELSALNQLLSNLGDDELENLEDAMEQLESMELLDPHISEEELDELKRKHRASESRALLKADMDYLKGKLTLMQEKGGTLSELNSGKLFASAGSLLIPPSAGASPQEGGAGNSGFDFQI
ncbi:MAG: hypothetical protein K5985_00815 [Lachnospiraceae bacterium]|nr:hypothetical protein [Lachnospiraceae bacterium]